MVAGRFRDMSAESLDALDQVFPIVHNPTLPIQLLLRMQKRASWRFYTKPSSLAGLAA
jgi:hypothetical protein